MKRELSDLPGSLLRNPPIAKSLNKTVHFRLADHPHTLLCYNGLRCEKRRFREGVEAALRRDADEGGVLVKVYLDGKEYTDFLEDADTASILSAVKGEASRNGRVVTEIRLDGLVMDEEAFVNVRGGLGVHFTSQSVRKLVQESLDEAQKYAIRLMDGLREVALHFEKNEVVVGQGQLAQAADGLDWLLLVFQDCGALLAVQEEETADSGLPQLKKSLSESVAHLEILHREKNYLEMALCIRQQLIPHIEQFSVHLQRLHDLGASTQ
jgi:hypothetical protein